MELRRVENKKNEGVAVDEPPEVFLNGPLGLQETVYSVTD
jgi:hypothetical protein